MKHFPKNTFLGLLYISSLFITSPAKTFDPQAESRKTSYTPSSPWNLWYDCEYSEQEWKVHLQKLKEAKDKKEHTPFEDPDFIKTCQILQQTIGNIDPDYLLIGMIYFQMTARKIGLASIKKADADVDFIAHQIGYLASAIQTDTNDFKGTPQNLRDFLDSDIQDDEKVINDKLAALTKKRLALKNLYYSTIPWRMLEALGKFSMALTKHENIYALNEQKLFRDALPDLIRDFQVLSRSFGSIIDYFYEERVSTIQWNLPHRPSFNGIRALGSFVRDKDSLTRITEILKALLETSDTSSLKFRYAVLRVLNIIGEAGIFLSPQLKNSWMDKKSWDAFKAVRDAFHDSHQQLRLHTLLLNTEDKTFLPQLLGNLRSLYEQISDSLLFSDKISWICIKNFYITPVSPSSHSLKSIIDLNLYISGHLLQEEKTKLLEETEAYYKLQQEPEKELRKLLLEDQNIDTKQRSLFSTPFDQIALSNNAKKTLEEAYKKRCVAEKQNKTSVLETKDKKRVEAALAMLKSNQDELRTIAENFHTFDKWYEPSCKKKKKESSEEEKGEPNNSQDTQTYIGLKVKLESLGVQSGYFFDLWEKYFQTLHQRTSLPEKKISKDKIVLHQIGELNITLAKIKEIFNEYVPIPPLERLERYQADLLISLATEYLLSSFRQHAQNLWDTLANFNDGKHPIISPTIVHLDRIIQRTKAILHNHDLTNLSTLTQKGREFYLISQDIPALLGEWFNLEFLLNNANYTMTLFDGTDISVPIVDKRAIPSKENPRAKKDKRLEQKQKRKKFLEKYPKLSDGIKFFSSLALQTYNAGDLKDFYSHLTVDDCFLLYTPPVVKAHDNLRTRLQQLATVKTFPKVSKSPQYSIHICIDEDGNESNWEEYPMPADNDCALHCFGISRKDTVKLLLAHSNNPVIRDLVAPEIIEAFREDRLPKKMKYQTLKEKYIQASHDLDAACRQANNELGTSGLQADEILSQNELNTDAYIVKLRSCVLAMDNIIAEINEWAKNEVTYKDFIQYHVGRQGEWLGYIRGLGDQMQTSTLDAIAHLKGVNLKISIHDANTTKLTLVHMYSSGFTDTIHMYHTAGLTHFNLLKLK